MHISPPYLLIMLALWNILLFITVLDRKYKEQILLKQTKLDLRQQLCSVWQGINENQFLQRKKSKMGYRLDQQLSTFRLKSSVRKIVDRRYCLSYRQTLLRIYKDQIFKARQERNRDVYCWLCNKSMSNFKQSPLRSLCCLAI